MDLLNSKASSLQKSKISISIIVFCLFFLAKPFDTQAFGFSFPPPPTPTNVSVTTTSTVGTLDISWDKGNFYENYLWESKNNGSYVFLGMIPPNNTGYTRTNRGVGTYKYKVNNCNPPSYGNTLCSGWGYSNTVTIANQAPSISNITNRTINEDGNTGNIAFTISDAETSSSSLIVTRESSNTTLAPLGNVLLGGSGGNRTVKVTAAGNQSGSSTITIHVSDGTNTTSETFVVTVNSVNDVPTITNITNRTINEDTNTGNITFTIGDAETSSSSLTVTRNSNNTNLVPLSKVELGGSGSNRTVKVTPSAHQYGTATITVTVSDGALSVSDTVTVTVNSVNDAPYADNDSSSTSEDTAININVLSGDSDVEGQTITPVIYGNPSNGSVSINGDKTIRYTPNSNYYGSDSFTYRSQDTSGAYSNIATVSVTVNAVNDTPTITNISNKSTNEDTSTASISFTIVDAETSASALTITGSSNNQSLVANSNIVFSGSSSSRSLIATPTLNQSGSATITVTVSDGSLSKSDTFLLTVNSVNDAPVADNDSANSAEDSSVNIAVLNGDSDVDGDSLTPVVYASPSNGSVLVNADKTIKYTPNSNFNGTDSFTYRAKDASNSYSNVATVSLTVTEVNDAPSISNISNRSVSEDNSTGSISFTVDDVETTASALTLTKSSSNTNLVANTDIIFGGSGENRTISVTPIPNASGSTTISATVSDGAKTSTESFVLTVNAVNDTPTVTSVSNRSINEDNNTGLIGFSIGDIETATSSLIVTGSSNNTNLVPNVNIDLTGTGANRNVTVTPLSNQFGTATITLNISDGNLSVSEAFTVTVNSVNDAPVADNESASVSEDSSVNINVLSGDTDIENDTLTPVIYGNPANGSVTINADKTIKYIPNANFNGSDSFTYRAQDTNSAYSNVATVSLSISAVNDTPTISSISDQTIEANTNTGELNFNISDVETPLSNLVLSATSSNENLVPTGNITFTGSAGARSVKITPTANQVGTSTVNITVSDGTLTKTESLVVTAVVTTPDWANSDLISVSDATLISPSVSINQSVGSVEGTPSVSGGAAAYSFPIALPQGRGGMQPNVSLNYSSRRGNSSAGVGWSVNAGSSIHRCSQTVAQDGKYLSVSYSIDDDRLCLDGQRLIVVNGSYGQSNSVYRTEMDSFAKITLLNGSINSTGSWFKVESKDGKVSYYGSQVDSRHRADGRSETLSWALSKVEDRALNKNHILYNYTTFGKGEHKLTSIQYTGDVNGAGDRSVIFEYIDNNDFSVTYLAGGRTESTQKLDSIKTTYLGNTVRTYSLNYGSSSSATSRNLLRGVTECATNVNGTSCLPETVFEWYEESSSFINTVATLDGSDMTWENTVSISTDFNGDGFKDQIIKKANNFDNGIMITASPSNNNQQQFISFTDLQDNEMIYTGLGHSIMDVDNNGLADILGQSNGLIVFYTWKNGSFQKVATNIGLDLNGVSFEGEGYSLTDINGDGKKDFIVRQKILTTGNEQALYWYKNTSSNNSISFDSQRQHLVDLDELILFVSTDPYAEKNSFQDLDGNGYPDILLSDTDKVRRIFMLYPAANNGVTLQEKTYAQLGLNANPDDVYGQFIDINTDGLSDYIFLNAAGIWQVQLNQGDGSYALPINTGSDAGVFQCADYSATGGAPCSPKYQQFMKWGDIDDDGEVELLVPGGATRIVDSYCHSEVDPQTNEPIPRGCGDELYFLYRDFDHSVYYANVIKFKVEANTVTVSEIQSDIKISRNTQITDVNADGLSDITYVFDGQYLANGFPAGGGNWTYQTKSSHSPDLLKKVTNGLGSEYQWNYNTLSSSGDLYQPDPWYFENLTGNEFHFTSSMYVVSDVSYSSGIGSLLSESYQYRVGVFNSEGRGFQGFKTIITESPSGIRSVTDFHQTFPLAGKIESVRSCLISDDDTCSINPISRSDFVYSDKTTINSQVHWVIPTSSITETYALNNRSLRLSQKSSSINVVDTDDYGNILKSSSQVDNGFSVVSSTVENIYEAADEANWWVNKLDFTTLKTQTLSSSAANSVYDSSLDPIKQIKTDYTWTAYRQPDVVTVTPLLGGGKVTHVNTDYNGYGLPILVESYEVGTLKRSVSTNYSNDGIIVSDDGYFPYAISNQLGQVVTSKTYPQHGQIQQVTDANGLVTGTLYDAFGRVEQVNPPSGTAPPAYSRFSWCNNCDALSNSNIVYKVETYQAGAPTSTLYKDKFNRVIVAKTEGFDAADLIYQRTEFDALGRAAFESVPSFFSNESKGTHYVSYDALGRLTQKNEDKTLGQSFAVNYIYNGYVTDISANGLTLSRTYSGNGLLMQTTDANLGITRYAYDSTNNPIVLSDANGSPIKAEYNALGQKNFVDDPNMGLKSFTYTGFGEVESETDAVGDVLSYSYDVLGRLVNRKINGVIEADFDYDGQCAGAPDTETRSNLPVGESYSRSYGYDSHCRPDIVVTTIDGSSYSMSTQYDDNYGRVKAVVYPNGLTAESLYNERGYITHSKNAASGYVYQQVTAMNARGQLTAATKANGILTEGIEYAHETGQMSLIYANNNNFGSQHHRIEYDYDAFGNLKQQIVEDSQNAHAVEDYLYDDLHRLTHSTQTIDGVLKTPIITSYDAVGNIVSKSDYATAYQAGDMAKTINNAGPNAVYELNKVGAGTVSFNYDAKGNMTSGDGKTITYNSFNKPLTITRAGITSSFSYGANQMRYKQVKTGIPGGDETTIYIDKAYEVINHNGVTTKRLYLGDSIITETGNGTGFKIGFVHRDRLGSVVTISDENGNVVDNKSFDPFGKPRKSNLEEITPATLLGISLLDGFSLHTNRGFTDHEHLDDAQLIHMNGRVYDYNLGRFLSIDPFIQDPGNSQSMNPYSYIMNNPLAGTDPSGYVSKLGCDRRPSASCVSIQVNQGDDNSNFKTVKGVVTTTNGNTAVVSVTVKSDVKTEDLGKVKGDDIIAGGGAVLKKPEVAVTGDTVESGTSGDNQGFGSFVWGMTKELAKDALHSAHTHMTGVQPEDQGNPTGLSPDNETQAAGADAYRENSGKINLTLAFLPTSRAAAMAKSKSIRVTDDVWGLSPTDRGNVIENTLAKTDYKGWFNVGKLNNGYFPLVDFQKGNALVSLKSVNTTGSTWMGRMQTHIKDLGSRGATVNGQKANMVLDLRVQPGGTRDASSLVQYGRDRGVNVMVKEF